MPTEAHFDVSAALRSALSAMRAGIPSDLSDPDKARRKSNQIAEGLYNLIAISEVFLGDSSQSLPGRDVGLLRAFLFAIENALNEFPDHRLATGSDADQSFTELAHRLANVRVAIEDDVLTPRALATVRELIESLGVTTGVKPA